MCHFSSALPCSDSTKRYCRDGEFHTEMGYEFFEGMVPISQTGVVMKEYSSFHEDQVDLDESNSSFTETVVRIRRIWHFPDPNPPESN